MLGAAARTAAGAAAAGCTGPLGQTRPAAEMNAGGCDAGIAAAVRHATGERPLSCMRAGDAAARARRRRLPAGGLLIAAAYTQSNKFTSSLFKLVGNF
jgi:hypothetical protein